MHRSKRGRDMITDYSRLVFTRYWGKISKEPPLLTENEIVGSASLTAALNLMETVKRINK